MKFSVTKVEEPGERAGFIKNSNLRHRALLPKSHTHNTRDSEDLRSARFTRRNEKDFLEESLCIVPVQGPAVSCLSPSKMSGRQDKEKGVNVQVILRCRPFSGDELRSNAPQVITCNDYQREVAVSQSIAGKHIDRVFTFDKVFGPSSRQRELYEQAIVPIVNEVLEGFNCTIFAYGQTGTGKTYTMEGDCKSTRSGANGQLPAGAGVIPRAIKQIFDTLESQNAEYSVKVTFLELYNEEITDLLAPEELSKVVSEDKQKKQLPLMEDGKGGVLVRGLEEEIVTSASEIFTLLERGSAKRKTAETLLNKQSSRSHSLFCITIHIKEATPEGEELIKCGKLNLVDLAGSENISRSGAREGRAREAGEINKSLLTLGRVISALVEHLGHVPYRDSKLTRLLRDSLGGRTKTCIIATVSPAVHCLEETLSTLDYAHRAKHIKNRPEVNQKMMKTTLIKDLYNEIERLKTEVYAAREKNGIYIPKERYIQEEGEKKAMEEQIERMGVNIENLQKQLEESQSKYEDKVQQCSDLHAKLDLTQSDLNRTRDLLMGTEKELNNCKYALKEKDFIILEQRKAEDALTQKACSLRSQLDKALRDNASLHSKIDKEGKLSAGNKSLVNNYQNELAKRLGSLCRTVAASVSQQDENLRSVDKLCHSLLGGHDEAVNELKKKMAALRTLYVSHVDALQNVVRLHKACSNASLEEISSSASLNTSSIEQFLAAENVEATRIHDDLQAALSSHQGEMAAFARELRKRFKDSAEHTREISELINGYLLQTQDEVGRVCAHAGHMEEAKMNSISEFQKAFEEQTKSDADKLIAEMTNLVNSHIRRQNEMVGSRLVNLREETIAEKSFLDGHVSSMEGITSDAKRKWEAFSMQAETDVNDAAVFSAAKHCRIESIMQNCASNAETVSNHWKSTHQSLNKMCDQHLSSLTSLLRNAADVNEQHVTEVDSARAAAEHDAVNSSADIVLHLESLSKQQEGDVSEILSVVKTQSENIVDFRVDHSSQASCIEKEAEETFQQRYMDYEPTGTTPARCEVDVPSKATIESLRAMPMDALAEEYRENHPFEPVDEKQPKSSLIPRPPLAEVN